MDHSFHPPLAASKNLCFYEHNLCSMSGVTTRTAQAGFHPCRLEEISITPWAYRQLTRWTNRQLSKKTTYPGQTTKTTTTPIPLTTPLGFFCIYSSYHCHIAVKKYSSFQWPFCFVLVSFPRAKSIFYRGMFPLFDLVSFGSITNHVKDPYSGEMNLYTWYI